MHLTREDIILKLIDARFDDKQIESLIGSLLWYGFLGVLDRDGSEKYIYNFRYHIQRLQAILSNIPDHSKAYCINPAFRSGLDIDLN